MKDKHLDNVNFDFIRYSNCWEDADVLLKGLSIQSSSNVMSIGSAGDNCFAMLSVSPEKVIAVDVSEVQLLLIELKKCAIKHFSRQEYLRFAGFKADSNRIHTFDKIKSLLSKRCVYFWENNKTLIEKGFIHCGKFENYFQLFKNEVLPTVHSQTTIDTLFEEKSDDEQFEFHESKWNTIAWKKMYRHFFGVEMMGTHGRDPAFLKYVKGDVPEIILNREIEHLRKVIAQKNYFLYYILNNSFDESFLPHYVREENYDLIQKNIDCLILYNGLIGDALIEHKNCTHFNLSDIFEYMDDALFYSVALEILDRSAPNAKIAYWNLMIPRKIVHEFPDRVNYLSTLSKQLKAIDLGYFYGDFIVEEKK